MVCMKNPPHNRITFIALAATLLFQSAVTAQVEDPQKAFERFRVLEQKAKAPDAPELMPFMSKERKAEAASMPKDPASRAAMIGMWNAMKSMSGEEHIKFVDKKLTGDKARLTYTIEGKEKGTMVVDMVHEADGWNIVKQGSYYGSAKPDEDKPVSTPASDWAQEAASTAFPQAPAAGKLNGSDFTPERVTMFVTRVTGPANVPGVEGGATLDFERDGRTISFTLWGHQGNYQDRELAQKSPQPGAFRADKVVIKDESTGKRTEIAGDGYGIHLTLGKVNADKQIPGQLVLRVDDKTFLQGQFLAKVFDPELDK